MNYDVVIGIEIHCELKTKTKMQPIIVNKLKKIVPTVNHIGPVAIQINSPTIKE